LIIKIKQYLNRHPAAKFAAADIYIYFIHLLHLLLDLTPGVIRNPVFRLMLARCGRHVYFDHRVFIKFPWLVEMGETISIGRSVEFYPDFFEGSKIHIGSDVIIAPNVRFHAGDHDFSDQDYRNKGAPIHVGNNVWIGAAALILPGVTIGDGAIIGAGSVVNKDVPARCLAAGSPVRVIRELDPA
jgi:maltose O-acetyltransferase